jgi:hypothetical protein
MSVGNASASAETQLYLSCHPVNPLPERRMRAAQLGALLLRLAQRRVCRSLRVDGLPHRSALSRRRHGQSVGRRADWIKTKQTII